MLAVLARLFHPVDARPSSLSTFQRATIIVSLLKSKQILLLSHLIIFFIHCLITLYLLGIDVRKSSMSSSVFTTSKSKRMCPFSMQLQRIWENSQLLRRIWRRKLAGSQHLTTAQMKKIYLTKVQPKQVQAWRHQLLLLKLEASFLTPLLVIKIFKPSRQLEESSSLLIRISHELIQMPRLMTT